MKKVKNIVYLYSEVMHYTIGVMRALVREFDVQVDCISWDQNKRTPFVPVDEEGITFHKRSAFDKVSIIKFIEERNPPLIFISGRMDKLYLETVMHFRNKIKIVTASDNQWTGSNKQRLAVILSALLYKRYFEYFWVPGRRQYEFARRIGYANDKIIFNELSGDTSVFGESYHRNRDIKKVKYPHTIVYAGRFAKTKGIDLLIDAFTEAKKELQNDWQLVLVGAGDMPIASSPFIKVEGFMSGTDLAAASKNWGVFCLPSTYEPWGVVVHEFTIAGLPIICSDSVGAADNLIINNYNGFIFRSGNKNDLKRVILSIMAKSDDELLHMGDRGNELSKMHSPVIAAYSLMSVLE